MAWKIHKVEDPVKRRRIAAALRESIGDLCHEEPMTAEKLNALAEDDRIDFGAGGVGENSRKQELSHVAKPAAGSKDQPARLFISTDEQTLNKTEAAFLQCLRNSHPDWIGIKNITLKLADDTRYTPDFSSSDIAGFVIWEVKGFWRDDARVKIKVAARMFPWARFIAVQKVKNGWKFEDIKP